MYGHLLVGVLDLEQAREVLTFAARLMAPGARVDLARVWAPGAGVLSVMDGAPHPSADGAVLLRAVRRESGLDGSDLVCEAGSVGRGLHRLAADGGADLIVIGSGRRTGEVRGDVRSALHGAPCALAVVPGGVATENPITRVGVGLGVGFEHTDAGEAALGVARDLAVAVGAELHGMTVLPPLPAGMLPAPVATLRVLESLHGEPARRARLALERRGALAHAVVGTAVRELRVFSGEVDLLVLGSADRGAVGRLLLGGTAEGVLVNPRCPVLVVPRGVRSDAPPTEPDPPTARTKETA